MYKHREKGSPAHSQTPIVNDHNHKSEEIEADTQIYLLRRSD